MCNVGHKPSGESELSLFFAEPEVTFPAGQQHCPVDRYQIILRPGGYHNITTQCSNNAFAHSNEDFYEQSC